MQKKLEIKVCGNTDKNNLIQVCALNPEYIGFIFYPYSKRFVKNPNLTDLVDCKAKRVGVFVNASEEIIIEKINSYDLDYVQLHGDETPGFCAKINEIKPVFKVFQINKEFNFTQVNDYISSCYKFLFDTSSSSYGGSGKKFDWNLLSAYTLEKSFILSGGIGPEDAKTILEIDHPQLSGVDLNSGFEISPGIKDIEALKLFFRQMRVL